MDEFDYWRLCDELSILDAAFLIAGINPASEIAGKCMGWKRHERPPMFVAAFEALCNAVKAARLQASKRYDPRHVGVAEHGVYSSDGEIASRDADGHLVFLKADPCWTLTTVQVDELRAWLRSRGFSAGFFFPEPSAAPADYLNPGHPRYAPKLAAAVHAWLAVDDPKGKHPKQALSKWLREHAARFGLSDEEGKPNETGIDEVAKVANWQQAGGAPRTPSEKPTPYSSNPPPV